MSSLKSIIYALSDQERLQERDVLLEQADRLLAECADPGRWEQKTFDNWAQFRCSGFAMPSQGWKLHVSATPVSAEDVLTAVLPILFEEGCTFKMVRSRRLLTFLNEAHSPRSAAGKFITIYPGDEAQAVRMAERLHQATRGLHGPIILSDARYRPDSLVHYRYGSFVPQSVYASDGRSVPIIRDPQGRPYPDAREAWFSPPPWITDPFQPAAEGEPAAAEHAAAEAPTVILVGGRYEVTQALRHANKGGVYLATDRQTGDVVVLKEARPHVGVDRHGRDATDRLRAEAENLERLRPLGVAPRLLDTFVADGHLFLSLDRLEGSNLRQARRSHSGPYPVAQMRELGRRVALLLDACHAAGMLIRDFNPNNLMILPDGTPRIIDVEMACPEGEELPIGVGAYTPGFASPQHREREKPSRGDDEYSLAATLFFLATGRDPYLVPDTPSTGRTEAERLAGQLRGMIAAGLLPAWIEPPIVEGMSPDPQARWSARRVADYLASMSDEAPAPAAAPAPEGWTPDGRETRALDAARDLVDATLMAVHTGNARRPVESSCTAELFDPAIAQHGVAGVGEFLLAARDQLDDAGREKLAALARWAADDARNPEGRHHGLYFGLAGAAWFLLDAAEALGDEPLRGAAFGLARALRPHPGVVDVTHGAAGIGLTLLHFHDVTGEAEFLDGARRMADLVLQGEQESAHGSVWPQTDPKGQPIVFYGFAHGTAGIGCFLLALWAATRDERYLAAAQRAAESLVQNVVLSGEIAHWPHGPQRPTLWTYWCNGSSGVGTFLVRMYQATGDERLRELSEKAGRAVYEFRWFSGIGQCHGLAGNGEFLLDLHQLLGDDRWLHMARELGEVLHTHRIYRDGRAVYADDSGMMTSPDFGVGWTGVGSFFYRLAMGGPRPFMADGFLYGGAAGERGGQLIAAGA